jgi:ferric-dicitrate binding protein FerR (iron transport regulator)
MLDSLFCALPFRRHPAGCAGGGNFEAQAGGGKTRNRLHHLRAGFTGEESVEFNRRLESNPGHAAVFGEAEMAFGRLQGWREMGLADAAKDELNGRARRRSARRRRTGIAVATGLAGAAAVAFAIRPAFWPGREAPKIAAATVEIRRIGKRSPMGRAFNET